MTDDLVKRPDDEQDDLTLVYMWAYKMAEKKYKARIEQLETALHLIGKKDAELEDIVIWIDDDTPLGQFIDRVLQNPQSATLGEKRDG
jgi:hypothetical protein